MRRELGYLQFVLQNCTVKGLWKRKSQNRGWPDSQVPRRTWLVVTTEECSVGFLGPHTSDGFLPFQRGSCDRQTFLRGRCAQAQNPEPQPSVSAVPLVVGAGRAVPGLPLLSRCAGLRTEQSRVTRASEERRARSGSNSLL